MDLSALSPGYRPGMHPALSAYLVHRLYESPNLTYSMHGPTHQPPHREKTKHTSMVAAREGRVGYGLLESLTNELLARSRLHLARLSALSVNGRQGRFASLLSPT